MVEERASGKNLRMGILWGLAMYVGLSVLFPMMTGDGFSVKSLYTMLPMWLLIGLVVGLVFQRYGARKPSHTRS